MTQAMVQRILWKEYRTFRSFWISIAVLTLLLQACLYYVNWTTTNLPLEASSLPFAALAMTIFYSLGVGSTLFNMEHEQQTYQQLRAWPSAFRVVWLGKLLFAIVSSLALGLVLSLITRCVWGPVPWWLYWTAIPIGAAILSVSILCSLIIQRPLLATSVAGAGSFGAWLLLLWWLDHPTRKYATQFPVELLAYALVACLGLLISYPLTRRWFADRPRIWTRVGALPRVRGPAWLPTATARWQLARMAWLSIRQVGWAWLGTFAAIGLGYLLAMFQDWEGAWTLLLAVWALVIGGTLFAGDQSGRSYRFFAERSVSDRQLWWQRQAIGLLVFAVALAATLPPVIGFASQLEANEEDFPVVAGYLCYCVLAFGLGQLASLCLRSPLLSMTITMAAAIPLVAWCLLVSWLRLPLWLSAGIPAVGLWTASRLRVGDWMLERDRPRYWLAPAGALLATALVAVGCFYLYRVYEVPWVEPIADPGQVAKQRSAAEEEAAEQVKDTLQSLTARNPHQPDEDDLSSITRMKARGVVAPPWSELPPPIPEGETTWLEQNQESLNDTFFRALEQLQSTRPPGRPPNLEITHRMPSLPRLMVVRAREQQRSGNLAGALASYRMAMHACDTMRPNGDSVAWSWAADGESIVLDNLLFWAAAKGQTTDQLQQAIDWSGEWLGREQEWTTPLMVELRSLQVAFADLPWSLNELGYGAKIIDRLAISLALIPGERQRWQRLLNVQAKSSLDEVLWCIDVVKSEGYVTRIFQGRLRHRHASALFESTPLVRPCLEPGFTWHVLTSNVLLENRRRATHIRLRLIDWQLKHGAYPTASEWQRAHRNAPLPRDVLTGVSFRYAPDGLSNEAARYVSFQEPLRHHYADASQQPLLASPEALRPEAELDRIYGDTSATSLIRSCVYPLPSEDVVLQY